MHKFDPAKAEKLESSERYDLIPPVETLTRFGLKKGMTFCDIGAGTGFFSRAAAAIVGPTGSVLACDMSGDILDYFRSTDPPANVTILQSGEYELPVADKIADLTLLAFVVHENRDTPALLKEAFRVAKTSGRVVIIEWVKKEEERGPESGERMAREELRDFLSPYKILEEGDLNESHYFFHVSR